MILPRRVDSCECGASRRDVDVTVDGTTARFNCANCGTMLIDDVLGAEP